MEILYSKKNFNLTSLDAWSRYANSKKYIKEDLSTQTYIIIPALDDLKKRVRLWITSMIHAYHGFKSVIAQDFILELPKDFSRLLSLAYWQDFQIKLANRVFDVGLQNSENLYLKYLGEGEDYESEPLHDMKEVLFDTKDPETNEDIEGFWND